MEQKKKSAIKAVPQKVVFHWAVILAIVATALVFGGGFYLMFNKEVDSLQKKMSSSDYIYSQQIKSLQRQIAGLMAERKTQIHDDWPIYKINEYQFSYPKEWQLKVENKIGDPVSQDNYNEEISFNDEFGNTIANLSCPMAETGYEGYDIAKENRSYKINSLNYGVDLWLGSQQPLEKKAEPLANRLAAIFMHRNNFDDWQNKAAGNQDANYSCQLVSISSQDLVQDFMDIYQSVSYYTPLKYSSSVPEGLTCQKETGEIMTLAEAVEASIYSNCLRTGTLKMESAICNEFTGTWWIDLAATKEGCAPACVINVVTKKAEINWRCTGLLTE
jgi:hypothetical protein